MYILVKDHKAPIIDDFEMKAMRVLADYYSDHIVRCGFCGNPALKGFVCDCGYDHDYNDAGDKIWVKVR